MRSNLKVLLVGDIVENKNINIERYIFDEDNPTKSEVENLRDWIIEAGYKVDIFDKVNNFIESGISNEDVLVFPLWRGGASRNRTAILPAYCESRNIPFVGGDAYVQAICQDKSFSKNLATAVGMKVPGELVIQSLDDLISLSPSSCLRPPFVVKPLYSACSIGIDDSSLCYNDEFVRIRTKQLFDAKLGPVVCEEFIEGEDISLCLIEERGSIAKKCVGAYQGIDGISPFYNRLFTFNDKINLDPPWFISVLPDNTVSSVWKSAESLIRKLGKVDIIRIDGRLNKDGFVLIELTPDIHLSLKSVFMGSFNIIGATPSVLIDYIIQSAIKNYK